jgi:[acyl-carrier-protein] S-malonyltransferase
MAKTALIFPGQGSQAIGMGVQAAEAFPEAAALFHRASEIAGYDMRQLCAEGPSEKLSRTLYTQPALFTVEAAITKVLKKRGVRYDAAAGHSLGEFGAWYAGGVFSFEDGFRLVSERGRLMDSADPEGKGAMAAIIGLSENEAREACRDAEGTVVVANLNSPQQMVISGERSAVEKAGALLRERGARRVLPLAVSGAFHSPLMEKIREEFAAAVEATRINNAAIPVYSNVTARQVTDAADIRKLMVQQLTAAVQWTGTVMNMVQDDIRKAYEIGPGNVLAGLIKRTAEELVVVSVSDPAGMMEVVNEQA